MPNVVSDLPPGRTQTPKLLLRISPRSCVVLVALVVLASCTGADSNTYSDRQRQELNVRMTNDGVDTLDNRGNKNAIRSGWQLASSASLGSVDGAEISGPKLPAGNWSALSKFPATVLAGLVEAGEYPELFFSQNLKAVDAARFDVPWWYRVELPGAAIANAKDRGGRVLLTFEGLNYRANIWCAGQKLASADVIQGAYSYFDVDATNALAVGDGTALAVQVFRSYDWGLSCRQNSGQPANDNNCRGRNESQSLDLGITWVDWAPTPADANMGLWRDVVMTTIPSHVPPVTVRYPGVATALTVLEESPYRASAVVSITAEVTNWGSATMAGSVHMSLRKEAAHEISVEGSASLQLPPGNRTQLVLNLTLPEIVPTEDLWWPWQMGKPNRLNLTMYFTNEHGTGADSVFADGPATTSLIGLRTASNDIDENGNALFRINGKPILVRGGGYAPDLLQRMSHENNRRQLRMTKDLGLNAIRLEGKLQDDDLFEQADEMGLLVLPGICCCDAWQQWDLWTSKTQQVAVESLRSQVKRLRRFPSVATFLYSSDKLPPPKVEQAYLDVFRAEQWSVGLISTASYLKSTLTGVSGVKMAGPYGYTDTNWEATGSAFGFATEISPGAAPLTLDSMKKTVAKDALWSPKNGPTDDWDYHCGAATGAFGTLEHFTPGIDARYGNGTSASDYLKKAQLASYESHRAMFEGYSRNKYNATGLIQWMLNSAWPSNMWHLFDYYYQAQKECGDRGCDNDSDGHIWAVNSRYTAGPSGMIAEATVYSLNGTIILNKSQHITEPLGEDTARKLFALNLYPPPAPPPANVDAVVVEDTDTAEDEYKVEDAASVKACCGFCVNDTVCTHSVFSDGKCWLKNMRRNDHGNTMLPIRAEQCTLCLKRETKPSESAATRTDAAATRKGTVLLRLRLVSEVGAKVADESWYWLPPVLDKFDDPSSCFTGCKIAKFADMRDLSAMATSPPLAVTLGPAITVGERITHAVELSAGEAGSGHWLAFFVRLRALDKNGDDVLPTTWSDNFVSLLAGESLELELGLEASGGKEVAQVLAEAFNSNEKI